MNKNLISKFHSHIYINFATIYLKKFIIYTCLLFIFITTYLINRLLFLLLFSKIYNIYKTKSSFYSLKIKRKQIMEYRLNKAIK